jgi:hypothetical protein
MLKDNPMIENKILSLHFEAAQTLFRALEHYINTAPQPLNEAGLTRAVNYLERQFLLLSATEKTADRASIEETLCLFSEMRSSIQLRKANPTS